MIASQYSSVVITGSISWDVIMDFPSNFVDYFQKDKLHQINVSFVVDSLKKQIGGTAMNIAYAVNQTDRYLSKLLKTDKKSNIKEKDQQTKNKLIVLGGIGKDGGKHLAFLKKYRIQTDGIIQDKRFYSSTGTVITDKNDNQIWGYFYGASERGKNVDFKKFIRKDSLFVISANHPLSFLAAQRYAIKNNIAYMYDVGMALSWIKIHDLKRGVYHCKWLIGNDYEIALITKKLKVTIKELLQKNISVITTLGEKGVRYESKVKSDKLKIKSKIQMSNSIKIEVPAFRLKKVIDPTGAGDAWRGGFISGVVKGLPIEDCLRIGNTTASFAVEKYGTLNYNIGIKELRNRLKCLKIQITK